MKNGLKFNNLDQTNMRISIEVSDLNQVNPCVRDLHSLFF